MRLPGRVTGASFDSADELGQAIVRAEEAHARHEEETGEADPDWPSWYARFMVSEQSGEAPPS